jgi:hypothetical protein
MEKSMKRKPKKYVHMHMHKGSISEVFIRLKELPHSFKKKPRVFKVKVKPRSVMGDYIALHGLVPTNELPKRLRGKIPSNEVWVRRDCVDTPLKVRKLLTHEEHELRLMTRQGLKYKAAHAKANIREGLWMVPFEVVK